MTTLKITCPHCRQNTSWEGNAHRPFCSDRCRTIDLGAWASEDYRIPVAPADNVIPFPKTESEEE